MEFNICVVQTIDNRFDDEYYFGDKDVLTLHPNKRFHYNDFLRYAYDQMEHKSDAIMICNDDITFEKGSVEELLKGMGKFIISSPKNPTSRYHKDLQTKHKTGLIKGYRNAEHFSPWCHLINKKIFDYIPVDIFWSTAFGGYFQDNWIVFLCLVNKIPIGLCADSIVYHNEVTSSPHADDREYFDMKQSKIFQEMKQKYLRKEL